MDSKKAVIAVAIILAAYSCFFNGFNASAAFKDRNGQAQYSLAQISGRVNNLDGKVVKVKGFLTGFGPIMILTEYENSNRYYDPALLVSHTELRLKIISGNEFVDLLDYFTSLDCIDRFAEVVGEIGPIGEQNQNGIVRIETITTFPDNSYSGAGDVCYSSS